VTTPQSILHDRAPTYGKKRDPGNDSGVSKENQLLVEARRGKTIQFRDKVSAQGTSMVCLG